MEVYIEYVILDNLIINYILLNLVDKSLRLNAKKLLKFLSSSIGTLGAIFMPFLHINTGSLIVDNLILISLKFMLGLSMILVIKKYKKLKEIITAFFLFLTFTFVLGGLCFGLIYILGLPISFSGLIINGFEIPISLFILLIYMYSQFVIKLVKIYKEKTTFSDFYYDVKFDGKTTMVTGFLDSGNQIGVDNGGVIIINYRTLIKLYPNINLKNLITGNINDVGLNNAKFVNMVNSSGSDKMLLFTIDKVEVIDHNNNVTVLNNQSVGLAKTNFYGKFDCLLSPSIFN